MKNIRYLPVYLFLETLALCMVVSILFFKPRQDSLADFERFGYVTATIGIILWCVSYYSKSNPASWKLTVTAFLSYPLLLWCVYEGIHRSPEALPASVKPYALQRGVSVLSGGEGGFWQQMEVISELYPIPDVQIQNIHLESIRGISQLTQSRYDWSSSFYEDAFSRYMTALSYKAIDYQELENKAFSSIVSSVVSGSLSPLTSRTPAQLSLIYQTNSDVMNYIVSFLHVELLRSTGYLPFKIESITKVRAENDARIAHFSTKAKLSLLDKELTEVAIVQHEPGLTWQETLRKSLTATVLSKAGLPIEDGKGYFSFPWRVRGGRYEPDHEIERIIRWNAPYLFNEQGGIHIPLSTFKDPEKVYALEARLRRGVNPAVRKSFERYYQVEAVSLMTSVERWKVPLAMPLYNSYLRIGAILPLMLLLSILLLSLNFVKLYRHSATLFAIGATSSAVAVVIFLTPALKWIMLPVLAISVPEPVLFVK